MVCTALFFKLLLSYPSNRENWSRYVKQWKRLERFGVRRAAFLGQMSVRYDMHRVILSINLVEVRACADGGANTLFDNFTDRHRDQ